MKLPIIVPECKEETEEGTEYVDCQETLEEHVHPTYGKLNDPLSQCQKVYQKYLPSIMKNKAFWMRNNCHSTILLRIKANVVSCCT
jgi:hypothetical protein